MNYRCSVCLNTKNNVSYIGREMMFGMRDEFNYFKCSACGCLQIAEIPDNLGKYYPDHYYSYQAIPDGVSNSVTDFLLKTSIRLGLDKILPVCYLSSKYKKYHKYKKTWLQEVDKTASILDIGCGQGKLLQLFSVYGFNDLTGIDPFIKEDTVYRNNVKIYKQDIYSINRQYDYVMLHHSLEHMPDPIQLFSTLEKIVTDNGRILIRIPVVDGYAWRKYQMDWFQVDAPRHLFLHTVKSIRFLAEQHGLMIDSIQYDSTYSQFTISEQYKLNISLSETVKQTNRKEKYLFKRYAKELNARHDGDQACFILKKKI